MQRSFRQGQARRRTYKNAKVPELIVCFFEASLSNPGRNKPKLNHDLEMKTRPFKTGFYRYLCGYVSRFEAQVPPLPRRSHP